jgi:flagellin
MISIHTNMTQNKFLNTLQSVTDSTTKGIERISSGKKINLSNDDVGSFSVSTNITSEVVGKTQGLSNTNHAISALKTIESASNSIVDLLIRSKELATEALNDGYTTAQRISLNREWVGHVDEIRRISANTEWNDSNLLAAAQTLNARVDDDTTLTTQTKGWTVNNSNAATGAQGGNIFESSVACPLCGGDDLRHNFRRETGTRDCVKLTTAKLESALASAISENSAISGLMNGLEVTAETLSLDITSLKNSLGNIGDADYASETSALAKSEIIAQATIALLAQANQDHKSVATLLQ